MKVKQRVLALMLSVMMIVTYMPAIAFAEDEATSGTDIPEVTEVLPKDEAAEGATPSEIEETAEPAEQAAAETGEVQPAGAGEAEEEAVEYPVVVDDDEVEPEEAPAVVDNDKDKPEEAPVVDDETEPVENQVDVDDENEPEEDQVDVDDDAEPEEDQVDVEDDAEPEEAPVVDDETEADKEDEAVDEAVYGKLVPAGEITKTPDVKTAGNDELLEQYFNSEVDKALGRTTSKEGKKRSARAPRYNNLNGTEMFIYDEILSRMEAVACGDEASTQFSINLASVLSDYFVETGISDYPVAITSDSLGIDGPVFAPFEYEGETYWGLSDEAKANLYDIDEIIDALLIDNPYPAYWFDKVAGYSTMLNAAYVDDPDGSDMYFSGDPTLILSLSVAEDYKAESGEDYTINTTKAASTASAVERVENIVEEYAESDDVTKLYGYKDTICSLTDYNYDAAGGGYPYGDPWQLIWVFDDDESTKVVCEGYSKAFQFLCDKSYFDDENIESRTVSGDMSGATGAGPHMWNIIRMDDGRNYIADITNCDEGTVGYPEDLFLKGYTDGSFEDGYYEYMGSIRYEYDQTTYSQYSEEELTLSMEAYNGPGDPYDPEEPRWYWSDDNVYSVYYNIGSTEELELSAIIDFSEFDATGLEHPDLTYEWRTQRNEIIGNGPSISVESMAEVYFCEIHDDFGNWDTQAFFVYPNYYSLKYTPISESGCIELLENTYGSVMNEGENNEYYDYGFDCVPKEGDRITVYRSEADIIGTVFEYRKIDDSEYPCYGFVNLENKNDKIMYFTMGSNISADNPWLLDRPEGAYYCYYLYLGDVNKDAFCEIPVMIVPPLYDSVEFYRGNSKVNELDLVENVDGDWNTRTIYDDDSNVIGEEEYFYYNVWFKEGDRIVLKSTENGDRTYEFGSHYDEESEGYREAFINVVDAEDVLYYPNFDFRQYKYQGDDPWLLNNSYDIYLVVLGKTSNIKVNIVENPVKGIELRDAEGNGKTYQLTEHMGGWESDYDEDIYGNPMYWYEFPGFESGDQLLVNYEGEVKTYRYEMGSEDNDWFYGFVNEEENDRIHQDSLNYRHNQSTEHPWVLDAPEGEEYYFVFSYEGAEANVPVTIVENPIKSIEILDAEGNPKTLELIDHVDGWESSDEEDINGDPMYWYEFPGFNKGDHLLVDYNGEIRTYIYDQGYDEDGNWVNGFVNEADGNDVINSYSTSYNQSTEHPWLLDVPEGEEYYFTISYEGAEAKIPVTIVENPIKSIEILDAEGNPKTLELIDHVDGWESSDEEDINGDPMYWYEFPGFNKGDHLLVDYNGEIRTYIYDQGYDEDGNWVNGFVNEADGNDVINSYSTSYNQSTEHPWLLDVPEGEEYYFTISYEGAKANVPVTIVENPIKSIEILDAEGNPKTIELIDHVDGWESSDEEDINGDPMYWYKFPGFNNGDQLLVDYNGEIRAYIYDSRYNKDDDSFYGFVNEADENDIINNYSHSNQSTEHPWLLDVPEGEEYYFTILYEGAEAKIPVTIVENPIKSIEILDAEGNPKTFEFTEHTGGSESDYEEDINGNPMYWYYFPGFNKGDHLLVDYNGEPRTYIWAYEADDNWAFGFVNEADENDVIKINGIDNYSTGSNHIGSNQSTEHPWLVDVPEGEEYYFTISYEGAEAKIPVTIVENPIKSIEILDAEGNPKTLELIDHVDGWESYEEDIYGNPMYWYEFSGFNKGDQLLVDYNGEIRTYIYDRGYDEDDNWVNGFVNEVDENDVINSYSTSYNQSTEHPWLVDVPEGEEYYFVISYEGAKAKIPVTITENPVKAISYSTSHEFVEYKECKLRYDNDVEYCLYTLKPKEGDILTVNGTTSYVYQYVEDEEEGSHYAFVNGNDELSDVSFSSNQKSKHWVVPDGELETNVTFTVKYMGRTCKAEAKLLKSPVTGISFTPVNEYVDLIENLDGELEGEEEVFFYYDAPSFENGDQLTVSYRDKDDATYVYKNGRFVNKDDSSDRINAYRYKNIKGVSLYKYQNGPWNLTEGDDYYETTVYYQGQTVEGKKIRILPNPIESIAFSRNGESRIELIDGKDSYTDYDYECYWEDDREYEKEYEYKRFEFWFKYGDRLTVNRTDGSSAEYEYRETEGGRERFVNIKDDTDILNNKYLKFYASPSQSHNNEWQVGETYTALASYMDKTAEIQVDILTNPVTNVVFEKQDGSKKVELIENIDGYWDDYWVTDDQYVDYFRYIFPEYSEGDKLIVTKNNGVYTYTYRENFYSNGKVYDGAFVNITTDEDVIFVQDIYNEGSNQADSSPWVKGGEGYYFELKYYGFRFRVPAEVVENPVSEIGFARDGYDEEHPIELTEGLDAKINSDGGNNRFFEYYLTFKNGDTVKITDTKGETSDYNSVPYEDGGVDVRYFENDKGKKIKPDKIGQDSDQTYDNQWKPGDGIHTVTLDYLTRTTGVKVSIKENPVKELSFVRPGSDDSIEILYRGDGYYEGSSFRYEIRFMAGDELYITYSGADDPVKYVATTDESGAVKAFVADGEVPAGANRTIDANSLYFRHNRGYVSGTEDYIMLMYQGMWTDVPVNVVENPVEGIEFVWKEGGDRVELIEGVDGSNNTFFSDEGSIEAFEYSLSFVDGDKLKVKYTGTDTPVTYDYDAENGTFVAEGTVPEGAPSVIEADAIRQFSQQNYYNLWTVGNDYSIDLYYCGSKFSVPVTIVENDNPEQKDINDCEVSFDHAYRTLEQIESTPYDDYFYVVHTGTILAPIVVDNGTTVSADKYSVRYTKVEFNIGANEWQIKDDSDWSVLFPTEAGVYFCEVSGKDPYTGTYDGFLDLIRIEDHNWGTGEITVAPTCKDGLRTYTCSICGDTRTEVIPATGEHTAAAAVHENVVAATCGKAGHYDEVVYCSVCGEVLTRETQNTPATGEHIPGAAVHENEEAATCGKAGHYDEVVYCSVCKGELGRVSKSIPATDKHTWSTATYTWNSDNSEVTGSHKCSVCGKIVTATVKTASVEVVKAPTFTEKGQTKYTSGAFAEEGFAVQTKTVETDRVPLNNDISQASDQTELAEDKAEAAESSLNENVVNEAEAAAAKAVELATAAETSAENAYVAAQNAMNNLPADATEEQKVVAQTNLDNAALNLAVAKQIKAAASSALAKSKTAAASVAAKKAAAASEAAKNATDSATAEKYSKEAEAYAAQAAQKAAEAEAASADANKEVTELAALAKEVKDPGVIAEINAAKASANTSASTAGKAATTADTSSKTAEAKGAEAKGAVEKKAAAEKAAAEKTEPVDPEPTPTPAPGSDPSQKGTDGTAVGSGASAAAAQKAITSMKSDTDPKGAVFNKLRLKSTKQTKTSIKLKWTKNSKAVKYVIYGNKCGKKTKPKKIASVKGTTKTLKKVAGKKIKKGTYYKFIVVALDKNNNVVSTSKLIHVATKGGKVGNVKSVSVKKSVLTKAKNLKKGKSLKLNAKAVAQSKTLTVRKHVAIRYESSNKKVATVTKKGVVKAKKKGTCFIYAYAQNGVFKKIKVTVK